MATVSMNRAIHGAVRRDLDRSTTALHAFPEERAAVIGEVPGPVLSVLTTVFGRGYRKDVAPVWHE